jgi:hypothetical protein
MWVEIFRINKGYYIWSSRKEIIVDSIFSSTALLVLWNLRNAVFEKENMTEL